MAYFIILSFYSSCFFFRPKFIHWGIDLNGYPKDRKCHRLWSNRNRAENGLRWQRNRHVRWAAGTIEKHGWDFHCLCGSHRQTRHRSCPIAGPCSPSRIADRQGQDLSSVNNNLFTIHSDWIHLYYLLKRLLNLDQTSFELDKSDNVFWPIIWSMSGIYLN